MNKYEMFTIEALTNMHVGSGEIHYDIVDNKIQRSPITCVPVVHSSGIKGALRYFYEDKFPSRINDKNKENIERLFGKGLDKDDDKSLPGHLVVFEANLLFLPLRASENVFYYATSPFVIKEYIYLYKTFCNKAADFSLLTNLLDKQKLSENVPFVTFDNRTPEIEDFSTIVHGLVNEQEKKFFYEHFKLNLNNVALFNDDIFTIICQDAIPVVARNKIDENGESENLFYEEVIPRRTRFAVVLGKENDYLGNLYDEFTGLIQKDIIQIGGDYSIGLGFTKISKVS